MHKTIYGKFKIIIEENRIYLENFEFRTKTHPENSFEIYNLIFSYDKEKEEKEET